MISNKQNRTGFAMITAIIVVIIIGGLMTLSLFLTAQTGKRTTDLYLYEQTVLYSKSAAELALLDIAQAAPCTVLAPNYTFNVIYDANVTIRYIYTDLTTCTNAGNGASNHFATAISTPEQNGSVLMDITVTTNEGTEPIRYFRRVIQKL